ncbi:MAG: TetR/AcrR family transcriptional regulator [Lewinellaceae bacterium]|nr:TetR/AcrR family transcriptional regulator [Lewinellaceae bacterium]
MNIKHDKETVIQKGLNLFCTEGLNAVGLAKICQYTGITKGACYNAVKSKEAFSLRCLFAYAAGNMSSELPASDISKHLYSAFFGVRTQLNEHQKLIRS